LKGFGDDEDISPRSVNEVYQKILGEIQANITQQRPDQREATQQRPVPTRAELDALYQDAKASNPTLTREEFNVRIAAQLGQ
jgi:hypothetical protein